MRRKGYNDIKTKSPLNDLVTYYGGARMNQKIEVRMAHREPESPDDPIWEETTLIATFVSYEYAIIYAIDFANHKYVWCGGVLVR